MRVFWTGALWALFLLGLGGCASGQGQPEKMSEAEAASLIGTALKDIEEIYYRETKASVLVADGLDRVESSWRSLRIAGEDDAFVATVDGKPLFQFKLGKDEGDADYWGGHVAAMLTRIEQSSAGEGSKSRSLSALADRFLEGVASGLDYRTRYWSPELVQLSRFPTEGGDGAVNLILVPEASGWRVRQVVSQNLRHSNLIRQGDLVIAVAGTSLNGLSDVQLLRLLRGPVGSPVEVVVERDDEQDPLTVTLHRESRPNSMLGTYAEGSAVRVVVPCLATDTLSDLKKFLAEKIATQEASLAGIILDLRGNMGGYLDAGIALPDSFLAEGRILSTYGRHHDSYQYFSASSGDEADSLPLVVLVDEHTASGGEIAASALQDNRRAIIVGATTFGAGTIQTVLPMPNSGELKLPWAEAVAAGGYRLDKRGVMPTICAGGKVTAEKIIGALKSGGGVIDRATRTRNIDPEDTAAITAFRVLCPPRADQDEDVALEVARAILSDPALYDRVLSSAQ